MVQLSPGLALVGGQSCKQAHHRACALSFPSLVKAAATKPLLRTEVLTVARSLTFLSMV